MATTPVFQTAMEMAFEAFQNKEYRSVQATARVFNVSRHALMRRIKRDTPDLPLRPPSHTKVNDIQDKQLCAFIQRLIQWNFPPCLDIKHNYVNMMLAYTHNQSGTPPVVGKNWPDRWVV